MLKTSSIRPVVSTQYRLVTDGRTHDDSIGLYRASTALRDEIVCGLVLFAMTLSGP